MKQTIDVAIIGAGRLGTALSLALSQQGYSIRTIVSRTPASAKRLARLFPAAMPLAFSQLKFLTVPDLLLITTPDDQISAVAEALESLDVPQGKRPVALHTSGALSSAAISDLSKHGWQVGSLHPLLSISDLGHKVNFDGAYWCIEGQPLAQRRAKALVRRLKGKSFSIGLEYKALYHAAAVMASGNVVSVFDVAIEMLTTCGLSKSESKEVLVPLLESTVQSLEDKTTAAALTGPFARGDLETIKLHLEALGQVKDEEICELYRILGRRSLKLSASAGLNTATAKKIKRILE
ncbi:MAG TPA: Rossmann-like and DUF2520 domain-containing protein [Pyrinomonadaceae bacterium]|nr:Rossmann-like and DUF2520 domain-containing protein [Pyrinomonadaceae bacterium]